MSDNNNQDNDVTLAQIEVLQTQTIARLAELKADYIVLTEAEKKRLVGFQSLLVELEALKTASLNAAKMPIPEHSTDANIEIQTFSDQARKAVNQERYVHWFTLDQNISVARKIFVQKGTRDEVIKDDIDLLRQSVGFTQSVVQDRNNFNEESLNKIKNQIAKRVQNYELFYKKNSLMPKVWGGLLIGLGALVMVAGLAGVAVITFATLGAGVLPAVGVGFGGMLAGISLIYLGGGYMGHQLDKLQTHQPIMTDTLITSMHTLYGKEANRDEAIPKLLNKEKKHKHK